MWTIEFQYATYEHFAPLLERRSFCVISDDKALAVDYATLKKVIDVSPLFPLMQMSSESRSEDAC